MVEEAQDTTDSELRIWLFGSFSVAIGRRHISQGEWHLHKAQSLMKLLALAPGHRLHREEVLDRLWPDYEPEAASNNLHHVLHMARRVLEPQRARGVRPAYLSLRDESLILDSVGRVWVDVEAFEIACAAARRAGDPAAYRAVVTLYAGDLLPEDLHEDWTVRRREELRARYLSALDELTELHVSRGESAAAIQVLQRLVLADPIREDAHVALMDLYALTGQRNLAVQQYRHLREALRSELDIEPDAVTQRRYGEILTGTAPLLTPNVHGPVQTVDTMDVSQVKQLTTISRPRDLSLRSANVEGKLTSFVGRQREMEELRRLLFMVRLLTVIGTGGCGKTRLVQHFAATLRDSFPDGVWIVNLASLEESALVPHAVASALGVREEPDRPLVRTLEDHVGLRRALLVLDNCEHLVDACAPLVEGLLRACPTLRILTTSRHTLGVSGETVWRLPLMDVPDLGQLTSVERLHAYDAVQLLVERASAYRPGFALTSQNAAWIVRICQRLDGIPLAIELAAGRLETLDPEQIATRLDDCFSLLTGASWGTLSRYQTLRAAIDWSHGGLSDAERVLFRRLAVFASGWTLAAAEQVCVGGGIERQDVLHLLSQLVDKSLITVAEHGVGMRYRLLETTRQYGIEKLQVAGEAGEARGRHVAWCVALAEEAEPQLAGMEQRAWLERLDAEHDNLRVALRWAAESGDIESGLRLVGALWRFWFTRGYLSEGCQWITDVLASSNRAPAAPAACARALDGLGMLRLEQGESAQATAALAQSLVLRLEQGDMRGVAESLNHGGIAACLQGETRRAAALLEQSLAVGREQGDPWNIAESLKNLGVVAFYEQDWACAAGLLEESLVLRRELGDKGGMAYSLINLGNVAWRQGDYTRASRFYKESLSLRWELDARMGIAACLEGLAVIAQARGQPLRVAWLLGVEEAIRDAIGGRLPPADIEPYLRVVAAARAALQDDDAFEQARTAGRATPLDQAIADVLAETEPAPAPASVPARRVVHRSSKPLTRREREVMTMIAAGLTNREIAAQLKMSPRTAGTHVTHVLAKLGLVRRVEVSRWMRTRYADSGFRVSGP